MSVNGIRRVVAMACALTAFPGAAGADCYDVFGCTERDRFRFEDLANGPNCDFLYEMRNRIYAQRGYCFHTPRAIATLGNQNCRFDDVNEVPLNAIERGNAALILQVEQAKGCPE
ncbi:MAG: YARHG domain-containing protein [Roseiarcus sp.]